MTDTSNSADCLDVRDLIERFEELETERDDLSQAIADAKEEAEEPMEDDDTEEDRKAKVDSAELDLEEWNEENGQEFKELGNLLGELEGRGGGDHQWKGSWYPVSLIRDSYFVDAMQELVSDIGDLPKDIPGYLAIDWEQTANNLKADYSSVEYGDVTYWYR